MKKLMMTLAVSLAATALMAEVVSKNIVGYTTTSTPGALQYQMYTPMFVTVGGEADSILLGSLVPNAAFEANGDYISFLSAAGSWIRDAAYATGLGWYDPSDEEISYDDVEIPAGTGFMISTADAGGELLCAGEVAVGDLEVAMPGALNYVMVGNPTPVEITLGDVVPNATFESNGDYISFMSAAGAWIMDAAYATGLGWYDPSDEEISYDDVVLQPGVTFVVSTADAGGTLTFPSPL
jgi:hypothetical protein